MVVGICTLYILLPHGNSLKEKRQIVTSIKDRIKARYNVSIAEVDNHDSRRRITLGIACVSNSSNHASQVLASIIDFVSQNYVYEMLDYEVEIL